MATAAKQLVGLMLLFSAMVSCAKPALRPAPTVTASFHGPKHCEVDVGDWLHDWRCEGDAGKLAMDYLAVYYESWQHSPNLEILREIGNEPTLVLDTRSKHRCTPNFTKTYVLSHDGKGGEMHIPTTCDGDRAEFVWHYDGEFSRYLGVRIVRQQ